MKRIKKNSVKKIENMSNLQRDRDGLIREAIFSNRNRSFEDGLITKSNFFRPSVLYMY